ncbi:MAG: hypothetical protein WA782_07910 [Sulfitobacter sp.]|jgi:hypothetical protein|tara:strand:+ start:13743 stop:14672 length:930 start_codon:yes stop_codon:yes gene_type:complete
MSQLYSDRANGPRPRTETEISAAVEAALQSLVQSYQDRDFFGIDFPAICPDNGRPFGTSEDMLEAARVGMVPEMAQWWRKVTDNRSIEPSIPTMAILDALEWHAKHAGEPKEGDYHSFFQHYHKSWDRVIGLAAFRSAVNEVLARNGLAYEMGTDGFISRILEGPVADQLRLTHFDSGDPETDRLLELARTRFFDRDPDAAQRSIEALWDAFERLKTHIDPTNKKSSAQALIIAVAQSSEEQALFEAEMLTLTGIGNMWRIRHHETNKHDLGTDRRLRDYLFLRMFTLLHRIIPGRKAMLHETPNPLFD